MIFFLKKNKDQSNDFIKKWKQNTKKQIKLIKKKTTNEKNKIEVWEQNRGGKQYNSIVNTHN